MKQRKTTTLIVLALEIATIVVLHAIKINQEARPLPAKDLSGNSLNTPHAISTQQDVKTRVSVSFAGIE